MKKPLTQKDLAGRGCELHGGPVGELFLHGRCHPSAGTRCSYLAGVLTVRCRSCKALIAEVAVASGAEDALVTALRRARVTLAIVGPIDAGDENGKADLAEVKSAINAALELAGVKP